jgi:hypothetical protein
MSDTTDLDLQGILEALDQSYESYPRELIQVAMDRSDELNPHLVETLQRIESDTEGYVSKGDSFLPTFAFHLLAHSREQRAHQVIIDLATKPQDLTDMMFGDMLTEDLGMVLWKTSGGSCEALKQMLEDPSIYPFVRCQGHGIWDCRGCPATR